MIKHSTHFIAIPPGESIKELLEIRNMTQKEFAVRMDMSEKHISKLINGEVHLTYDMAFRLESVFGGPASFWTGLENSYRESLIKINQENGLDDDIELLKTIPYKKLSDLGWVPETKDKYERVRNLRKFFEVVNLNILKNENVYQVIGKDLDISNKKDACLLACIQRAILEARDIESKPFNKREINRIIKAADKVVATNPEDMYQQLKQVLEQKGILLMEVPIIDSQCDTSFSIKQGNRIIIGICLDLDNDHYIVEFYKQLAHIKFLYVEKGNQSNQQLDQWVFEHLQP